MAVSQEDKYARRVFMHLNSIQAAISDKAAMLTEAGGSEAYQRAVSGSAMMFMHHVADPDTDLDTVDIHGWPWPKPEDFPEEAPVLILSEALEALEESMEGNPDLFDDDDDDEGAHADEPPAEPEQDPNVIPDALARFAEADESAEDFRKRLKSLWQRFGIDDGKNFPGGGEPLSGDEKIKMREIDILLNSDEGQNAKLLRWLMADEH